MYGPSNPLRLDKLRPLSNRATKAPEAQEARTEDEDEDETKTVYKDNTFKIWIMHYNMDYELPPRFRESAFRRFEAHIEVVVGNWPKVQTFCPVPFSPETFCCRMRDAMTSLFEHNWKTNIPSDKFHPLWEHRSIALTHNGGVVVVGPRGKVGKKKVEVIPVALSSPPTDAPIHSPNPTLLRAIITCLQYGALKSITITGLDHNIQFPPDIEVIKNRDGSITLL